MEECPAPTVVYHEQLPNARESPPYNNTVARRDLRHDRDTSLKSLYIFCTDDLGDGPADGKLARLWHGSLRKNPPDLDGRKVRY